MYKQFCKNLYNFIDINQCKEESYRIKIAKDLIDLTNIDTYNKLKEQNHYNYKRISNFIYKLSEYNDKYPSLENFLWELWGYGFDAKKFKEIDSEPEDLIKEKAKLIDLLLSTHYWS